MTHSCGNDYNCQIMDPQEKLISELLNNIRGCNLINRDEIREDGGKWESYIHDYFANDKDSDSDDWGTDDGDDADSEGELDELEEADVHHHGAALVPFDDGNGFHGIDALHVGEAIAAEQARDLVSDHYETEKVKVEGFKCACKNEDCHKAFNKQEMLDSRLELRAFNEGELYLMLVSFFKGLCFVYKPNF